MESLSLQAINKATSIITKRSSYIRAMNLLISDGTRHWVSSQYSEDPDYFQMHRSEAQGLLRVCSMPFEAEPPSHWQPIEQGYSGEL